MINFNQDNVIWPELPLGKWQDTKITLHMWTQIVGKIKLALSPNLNHWWGVTLFVTPRGLTTSPISYKTQTFQIDFDFIDHYLLIETSQGKSQTIKLAPMSVADFYQEIMRSLSALGIEVTIWPVPVEVENRIPFDRDTVHASYDPEYAQRFWRILAQSEPVFKEFRARFIGKASPVHFFWGAFDLAATRFSGRRAPQHPGSPNVARAVMVEAYSHEVCSCGFWPGTGEDGFPSYYTYAYPEPDELKEYRLKTNGAYYDQKLGEFIIPYDIIRKSGAPEQTLMDFLQETYDTIANLAHWDRATLERNYS